MKYCNEFRRMGLLVAGLAVSFPVAALAQAVPEKRDGADTREGGSDIVVTGSLLPGTDKETAGPMVVITAEDMQDKGFGEVSDALRSQSFMTGAMRDSTPGTGNMQGVKQINLFGLGASYTKVLVNGRPTANYPLNNNSGDAGNFANLANVPMAMVDRIEILPGTQSAIYGADAVAGVVNIILKTSLVKTTVSLRGSGYSEGGGRGIRAQLTGGVTLPTGGTLTYGWEFNDRQAILGIDRAKTAYSPFKDEAFARLSSSSYYDPGTAGCAAMAGLFGGTMTYRAEGAARYCGSDYTRSMLATYDSARRNGSGYLSLSQPLSGDHVLYADLTGTLSRTVSNFGPVYVWQNFLDTGSGRTYLVSREIAPEEMGGWTTSAARQFGRQYDVAIGARGPMARGGWRYDFYGSRSDSRLKQKTLLPVQATMTSYLAQRYGNIAQVFVPLTPEEYRGFSGTQTRLASNRIQQILGKVFNSTLLDLPGGSAGLAIQGEIGDEKWIDTPDAGYQAGLYFGGAQLASLGSRRHAGVAGELALPVLPWLSGSFAARYDGYGYVGKSIGRATWKGGVELHPVDSLVFRGGMGTAFRAPDMSYLFLGQSTGNSNNYDLYLCDQMGVSRTSNSCRYIMRNTSSGNLDLKPVTARSWTVGAIWSPTKALRLSADFMNITIRNEVRALTVANILFDEAACREGRDVSYLSSCDYARSLVKRDPATGRVTDITRGFFNVSTKQTQALMIAAQYTLPAASIGTFRLDANYNRTLLFKSQADSVSPIVDQLRNPNNDGIFKDILNASVTLDRGPFSGTVFVNRYGASPNYALLVGGPTSTSYGTPGWDSGWTLVNLSARYDLGAGLNVSGVVNNVANRMPPSSNWQGFPGYNASLFNVYGRSFMLEVSKSF